MSELNPDTYIDVVDDELVDKATEATEEIKRANEMRSTLDDASRKSFNLESLALVLEGTDLGVEKIQLLASVGLDEPGLNPEVVVSSYSAEGFIDGAKMILEKIIEGLKRLWDMIRNAAKRLWELLTDTERGLRRLAEAANRRTHLVPKGDIRLGMEARYVTAGNRLPATYMDIHNALKTMGVFGTALFVEYSKKMPGIGRDLIKSIREFNIASPEASLIKVCNVMQSIGTNPVAALCHRVVTKDTRFDAGGSGKVLASEALLFNHSFFYVSWDSGQQGGVLLTAEKIRRTKLVFKETFEQQRAYDTEATIPAFFAEGVSKMAIEMANLLQQAKEYTSGNILDQCKQTKDSLEELQKRVESMRTGDDSRRGPVTYYRAAVDFVNTYANWTSGVQLEYANYLSQVGRSILRLCVRNLATGLK